jgi:septation ring formation regulator EzrA
MSKKKAYQQKIEAQLEEWKSEIDTMKAKAKKAGVDVQSWYYKQLEDLQSKQESVQEKIKELKGTGEDSWEDIKAGVDLAWKSLGEAVKSASSRFK